MFKGHPKGLFVCFFASMGERFGWYTMLAIFTYYLQERFGWSAAEAGEVYSTFMMVIYLLPIVGGWLAERYLGYGRSVAIGIVIMTFGYAMIAVPSGEVGYLIASLAVISIGTGLFKGNLAVIVGNLYEAPELRSLRDAAFNIYYMGINCGAFLAPFAAEGARIVVQERWGYDLATGYNAGFAVAVVGLVFSFLSFVLFRKHYRHADFRASDKKAAATDVALTPKQTRDRVGALIIVFGIVIFFWMIFQQNGLTLSLFARDYTVLTAGRITNLFFDLWGLLAISAVVLGGFFLVRKGSATARAASGLVAAAGLGVIAWRLSGFEDLNTYSPELFQSFNPLFIVFFTPLVLGFFAWLNRRGREPSSPAKIGIGMWITAVASAVLVFGSLGLPSVASLHGARSSVLVSPYWLISTYFVFTLAELFLSPLGMSFVAKVSPPKLRGVMQGGWMAATGIGNKLTGVVSNLYERWELWQTFLFMVVAAAVAAVALFLVLPKLRAATGDK